MAEWDDRDDKLPPHGFPRWAYGLLMLKVHGRQEDHHSMPLLRLGLLCHPQIQPPVMLQGNR